MAKEYPQSTYIGTTGELAEIGRAPGTVRVDRDLGTVEYDVSVTEGVRIVGRDGYTPVKGVDYFDGAPGTPGKDGTPGAPGAAASVRVSDEVEALPPGSVPTVQNLGTSSDAVLKFGLPSAGALATTANRGLVFLGDSITFNSGVYYGDIADDGANLKIASDGTGTVAITLKAARTLLVNDFISIRLVEPAEFRGDFFISRVVSTTVFEIKNSKVTSNTKGRSQIGTEWVPRVIFHRVNPNWFGALADFRSGCRLPAPWRNISETGSRIEQWLNPEYRWLEERVYALNPEYIHILHGNNDLHVFGLDATIKSFETLIGKLEARGYKLIIGTLIPPLAAGSARVAGVVAFNAYLRNLCQAKGYPLVDYFPYMADIKSSSIVGITANYVDTYHQNAIGDRAMSIPLAKTLEGMGLNKYPLPVTNGDNWTNGDNVLTNPLIITIRTITGQATGTTGTEQSVYREGCDVVCSVTPRTTAEDGDTLGNNAHFRITFTAATSGYASLMTKQNLNSAALAEDRWFVGAFSTRFKGSTLTRVNANGEIFINGTKHTLGMYDSGAGNAYPGDGAYTFRTHPFLVKAGSTIGEVSANITFNGDAGEADVDIGRMSLRLTPADSFRAY